MVCFYVFIGFWILFVFRSDLYCIEFFTGAVFLWNYGQYKCTA